MKIGLRADAHFSLNSSIVLGSQDSLHGRLDLLIKSFEWSYGIFQDRKVDAIVDLGDLVESYNLRAEEITALSLALSYNPGIQEYDILGNHERKSKSGEINSIEFLENIDGHTVVKEISQDLLEDVTFIPYGQYSEEDLEDLKSTKIAFSHIDIFGADTGGWSLKSGVSPEFLTKKFKLTINGHIHNGSWVIKDKILNIGAISGQNFSSKIINWKPSIGILDTDTLEVELIENPYSLNFYSKSFSTLKEVVEFSKKLKTGQNAVQIKVPVSIVEEAREVLNKNKVILASRIMSKVDQSELGDMTYEEIDRLDSLEGGFKKLVDYIEEQEEGSLPYEKNDILKVISELEHNSTSED